MTTVARAYVGLLVDHETRLWNTLDRALVRRGVLSLGRLAHLRIVRDGRRATGDAVADAKTARSGVRVQDVAEGLGTTVGAASRLTDRLVADGLLERLPHPDDRRSMLLKLTALGRDSVAAAEAVFDEVLGHALGGVDTARLEELTAGLRAVARAVADAGEVARASGAAAGDAPR